jgi:hypothetical protein
MGRALDVLEAFAAGRKPLTLNQLEDDQANSLIKRMADLTAKASAGS